MDVHLELIYLHYFVVQVKLGILELDDFIQKTNSLEFEELADLLIELDAVLKLYCYTKFIRIMLLACVVCIIILYCIFQCLLYTYMRIKYMTRIICCFKNMLILVHTLSTLYYSFSFPSL